MKKYIFISIICFTFVSTAVVYGQTNRLWSVYGIDNHFVYWYDSTDVKSLGKNTYSCWIKVTPFPDSLATIRNTMMQLYNPMSKKMSNKLNNGGYDRYAYTMNKVQIDCAGAKLTYLNNIDHDEENTAIRSQEVKKKDMVWQSVVPGSLGGTLMKKVCH